MIPIIYEYDEAAWTSNGLGRLYDCLTAEVTEERNGVYEAEFTYPVSGANFDLIKKGRIVALTHDDSGVVQPFQIVTITRPIDGIVTFRAVHISYRLNGAVAVGSDIGSMAAALNLVNNASPDFGFTITSDITSTELLPIADGIPKTVRQIINGGEGSILDTYGGEIECDGWTVYIRSNRGVPRDFTIRYGINMTEYQDVEDWDGTYNSVLPYYAKNDVVVVGPPQYVNHASSWTGRTIRVPLDVTAECGDTVPGTGTVGIIADRIINQKRPDLPLRNMTVDFVRLQDFAEYQDVANLYTCRLCDTVNVSFPEYGTTGAFKVVKTVWDALGERYLEMELGNLSTTLSDALGISATASSGGSGGGGGIQSVVVTPSLSAGTKVADIDVDGATATLYAPTPPSASSSTPLMDGTASAGSGTTYARGNHVHPTDTSRQATLVSGTNIKTVNNTSLLGSGNIAVQPTLVSGTNIKTVNNTSLLGSGNVAVQPTLVSGTNIKTINGTSLLGSGDITISSGGGVIHYGECSTSGATAAKTVSISSFKSSDLVAGAMVLVKFTAANGVASPTLNVSGTGAKSIRRHGTTTAGASAGTSWNAGAIVCLIYDGTAWYIEGWLNTTYSNMTEAQYQAGTSNSAMLISPARLKAAIEYHAPDVSGATTVVDNFTTTNNTFSPTQNGIVTFCWRASANGSYLGIQDTTQNRYVVQMTITTSQQYGSACFPVVAGHTYKIVNLTSATSQVATVVYFT